MSIIIIGSGDGRKALRRLEANQANLTGEQIETVNVKIDELCVLAESYCPAIGEPSETVLNIGDARDAIDRLEGAYLNNEIGSADIARINSGVFSTLTDTANIFAP